MFGHPNWRLKAKRKVLQSTLYYCFANPVCHRVAMPSSKGVFDALWYLWLRKNGELVTHGLHTM